MRLFKNSTRAADCIIPELRQKHLGRVPTKHLNGCSSCQRNSRSLLAAARRQDSSKKSNPPQVSLKELPAFQRWGVQTDIGNKLRFFSFGKKLPEIVQESDDPLVLRQEADDIADERFGTDELRQLAADMIAVMRKAPGVGLAAPQIGLGQKIIVLEDKEEYMQGMPPARRKDLKREPFAPLVICNPKLQAVGNEGYRYWEGCLSVLGYQALVDRYTTVKVTGKDVEGKRIEFKASGWQARILQHECDHVNGTLYVDRAVEDTFMVQKPPSETGFELKVDLGPCKCRHDLK